MSSRRGFNIFLRAGVPLIGFICLGAGVLSVFLNTTIELRDRKQGQGEMSISTRKFDLEEENRQMLEKLDIDNFKLSRIPRPEEELKKEIGRNDKLK